MCAERFAFPDRDKVHMVIEDGLPGGCAIVLHDFDAIGSQRFFLRSRQFLAKDDDMLQRFRMGSEKIGGKGFRDNQAMSFALREGIHEGK